MIRKLLPSLPALAIFTSGLFLVPAGQDRVMIFAAANIMQRESGNTDNLNRVPCGTASPLGQDPTAARAGIAVLTPDTFILLPSNALWKRAFAQGLSSTAVTGRDLMPIASSADSSDIKISVPDQCKSVS